MAGAGAAGAGAGAGAAPTMAGGVGTGTAGGFSLNMAVHRAHPPKAETAAKARALRSTRGPTALAPWRRVKDKAVEETVATEVMVACVRWFSLRM